MMTKIYNTLLILGIICFLALIFAVNLLHFTHDMNADIASCVVLTQLMGDSLRVLPPPTWISSAELFFISTPNVAALIYMPLGDANLAYGLACCLMTVGIISSIYVFMGQLGLKNPYKLLMVFLSLALPCIIDPISMLYLPASYYSIHVITLFISLTFYHGAIGQKVKLPVFFLSSVLALLLGIQGFRGLLLIYAPLLSVELLRNIVALWKNKHLDKANVTVLSYTAALCVFSYIGTLFPISIGYPTGRNMRGGFNDLMVNVLPDLALLLGLNLPRSQPLHALPFGALLILSLAALAYIMSLLIALLRNKELSDTEWAYLVLPASLLITIVMTAFTTTTSAARYYFMAIYTLALSTVMLMQRADSGRWRIIRALLLASAIIVACVNISRVYLPILRSERPPQTALQAVADHLLAKDYAIAYSTFNNAGPISVLADNQIIVAAVADPGTLEISRWLNSWEFFPPYRPYEEHTAYVFTAAGAEAFQAYIAENGYTDTVVLDVQIGDYLIYSSPYNLTSAPP